MPLSKIIRDTIAAVGPAANRRLNLTTELLRDLEDKKIILERHRQVIDGKAESYKKKLELLDILPRRSDVSYSRFLDTLKKHGNEDVASIFAQVGCDRPFHELMHIVLQ